MTHLLTWVKGRFTMPLRAWAHVVVVYYYRRVLNLLSASMAKNQHFRPCSRNFFRWIFGGQKSGGLSGYRLRLRGLVKSSTWLRRDCVLKNISNICLSMFNDNINSIRNSSQSINNYTNKLNYINCKPQHIYHRMRNFFHFIWNRTKLQLITEWKERHTHLP